MQNQVFNLKPSRQYKFILGLLCLLAFIAIVVLPISIFIKICLFLALFFYVNYLARPLDIIQLRYTSTIGWFLVNNHAEEISANLLGDSTVTAWVSVLRFKIPHHRFSKSCLVFRDSLASGQYRELILMAKIISLKVALRNL